MLQENVFDPILNRVNVKTIAERHKKLKHKTSNDDDDDDTTEEKWRFKNFKLANWSKSQKLGLVDDQKEYFRSALKCTLLSTHS